MKKLKMAGAAVLLAGFAPVQAGTILGGSDLLDPGSHAQLERWLGQGPFDLLNVFTRKPGDTSADFHTAADNRGPTLA